MATKIHFETNLVTAQNKPLPEPWPHYFEGAHSKDRQILNEAMNYGNKNKDQIERSCNQHGIQLIRETMLRQEETFKAQVEELHRLYHVQKSLMAELKSKGFDTSPHSSIISESSPPTFQLGSHHAETDYTYTLDSNRYTLDCRDQFWDKAGSDTFTCDFLGKNQSIRLQEIKFQTQKDNSPSDFDMSLESDVDVTLTLGIGSRESQSESRARTSKSNSSSRFPLAKPERDDSSSNISSEVSLFPLGLRLVSNEATHPDKQKIGAFQSIRQQYRCDDDCRVEWQKVDCDRNKNGVWESPESQSRGTPVPENHKKPHWLVQALNQDRT
eukprot:TRINITY_DN9802_c0_g1_i1.p1 TRINITY_DN9802_c0_g1~~TRINITY_DN9802_c0_g1_i1.p1  ORF type:complete len:327 (+),score=56.70 TRINITY_DN9802_c0_g1_i1:333-1313(+)